MGPVGIAAGPSRGTAGRLTVDLGPLRLANPVMPASGCFGPELAELTPVSHLGAVVTKTVFASVRSGNPAHRLAETSDGMLNSVGIPSVGLDRWRENVFPRYQACDAPLVVSLGGLSEKDYLDVAVGLADLGVAAFELNLSCPNLEAGGLELGADPEALARVVTTVRDAVRRPIIAKLTPNTANLPDLAQAAAGAGAAAVTVANTFVGMAVDLHRRRPSLGNGVGGLSGPAMKPLILRLVWQITQAVDVPVIACGGITNAYDVAEYLLTGAAAVQVGTATFTRPQTMAEIVSDLPRVLDELETAQVKDLIGALQAAC